MREKTSVILLICFCIHFSSYTQTVRKYANEFLNIGAGGRGFAMANANTAICNDANAIYYNPAALSSLASKFNGELLHAEYFAGIAKYDYVTFAMKVDDKSGFGVSMIRLGIDDIPNTLDLVDNAGNFDYRRIKTFSVADYAFLFAYARLSSIEGLQYGGTLKIINRQQGEFAEAYGFGFDVGVILNKESWIYALNLKDASSTFSAWSFNTTQMKKVFETTGNELPENSLEILAPSLILAIAKKMVFYTDFVLKCELDTHIHFDGRHNEIISSNWFNLDPYAGFELKYLNLIALRFGFSGLQKTQESPTTTSWSAKASTGIGVQFKKIGLNYSLSNAISKDFYSNVFSLQFSF